MQAFANSSEEGKRSGLGWIPGTVKKFHFNGANASLKIPHMGWNQVIDSAAEPLLNGIREDARFYFVHSYYFDCENKESFAAATDYGGPFASIVRKDNVVGVQFHAEKSHRFGLRLFENFLQC